MQPGVCSLRDGALVTGSDWLWVLERGDKRDRERETEGGEKEKRGTRCWIRSPFDFQEKVCDAMMLT